MTITSTARFFAIVVSAMSFAGATARGETLTSTDWGFSVAFPCQSETSATPQQTSQGVMTTVSYSCTRDGNFYMGSVTQFPANSDDSDAGYTNVLKSAAANVNGVIRSVANYTVGDITGRDALVDVPDGKFSAHYRIMIVGPRLYQYLVVSSSGTENGEDATAFLNSWKFTR